VGLRARLLVNCLARGSNAARLAARRAVTRATLASQHCTYTAGIHPSPERPLGQMPSRWTSRATAPKDEPPSRRNAQEHPSDTPGTSTSNPGTDGDPDRQMRYAVGFAGTAHRAGNGLAFGAAAGTLHPSADRPLSRPAGSSHGGRRRASRALRGPADRPLRGALDPAAVAVGRARHATPVGDKPGRPPATEPPRPSHYWA